MNVSYFAPIIIRIFIALISRSQNIPVKNKERDRAWLVCAATASLEACRPCQASNIFLILLKIISISFINLLILFIQTINNLLPAWWAFYFAALRLYFYKTLVRITRRFYLIPRLASPCNVICQPPLLAHTTHTGPQGAQPAVHWPLTQPQYDTHAWGTVLHVWIWECWCDIARPKGYQTYLLQPGMQFFKAVMLSPFRLGNLSRSLAFLSVMFLFLALGFVVHFLQTFTSCRSSLMPTW
jgi:hypothetical protein